MYFLDLMRSNLFLDLLVDLKQEWWTTTSCPSALARYTSPVLTSFHWILLLVHPTHRAQDLSGKWTSTTRLRCKLELHFSCLNLLEVYIKKKDAKYVWLTECTLSEVCVDGNLIMKVAWLSSLRDRERWLRVRSFWVYVCLNLFKWYFK